MNVLPNLPPKSVDLAVVDWPYNVGIASWDKIEAYSDFVGSFLDELVRVLKDNATVWAFHMHFEALAHIHYYIETHTSLRHKQLIVINKGKQSVAGRVSRNLRSLPKATEYVQLYTFDDPTGAERLGDVYANVNPMAKYLSEEISRSGVSTKEITSLFPSRSGGLTGCLFNWLSGLNFPTKPQYLKIRNYLNRGENKDYLRRDYEDLRRDYEDLRYTFNIPYGVTDVWDYSFYEKVSDHPTEKPLALIERIIQIASKEGDLVLDPFLGSGTTAVACEVLKRRWIGIEIDPEYCNVARRRLTTLTNQSRLTVPFESGKEGLTFP